MTNEIFMIHLFMFAILFSIQDAMEMFLDFSELLKQGLKAILSESEPKLVDGLLLEVGFEFLFITFRLYDYVSNYSASMLLHFLWNKDVI